MVPTRASFDFISLAIPSICLTSDPPDSSSPPIFSVAETKVTPLARSLATTASWSNKFRNARLKLCTNILENGGGFCSAMSTSRLNPRRDKVLADSPSSRITETTSAFSRSAFAMS
jgi:hypothetical protein